MTNLKLFILLLVSVTLNGIITYVIIRTQAPATPEATPVVTTVTPVARESFAKSLACADETKQFCAGKTDLALDACLQDHSAEVGKECHDQLFKSKVQMADCEKEIAQYCAQTPFGGGRIRRCLLEHTSGLNPKCLTLIGAAK